VWKNLCQNDKGVAHLQVFLGLETDDKGLGELIMPFVANVAEVLVVEWFLFVGGC